MKFYVNQNSSLVHCHIISLYLYLCIWCILQKLSFVTFFLSNIQKNENVLKLPKNYYKDVKSWRFSMFFKASPSFILWISFITIGTSLNLALCGGQLFMSPFAWICMICKACILIGKTPGTVIFMHQTETETHADMIFLIMVLGRHFGMY